MFDTPRQLAIVVAIALSGASVCLADTWYVSPAGDDSGNGSISQPWQTLGKAAATAHAGDTVYLRSGTWNERLMPLNSGVAGAPIVFASYPGEAVILNGTGLPFSRDEGLVDLSGRGWIVIRGLRVINSPGDAIYADGASSITIESCVTDTSFGSGIGIWNSADVVVDGNEVIGACISGYQEHLTIANTTRFEVKNNHVHHAATGNFGKEGLSLKDGSSFGSAHHNHVHDILDEVGIYVDAEARYTHDIDVYSNRIHDIGGNCISIATEAGGLLEDVRVYNNIGYGCKYLGLNVSVCCPAAASHPIHGVTVVNNTFVGNGIGWGGGIGVEGNADLQALVIRNNLLSENLTFQLAVDSAVPQSQLTVDHNLIDTFQGGEGEIVGTDAVQLPAQLIDANAHDFRLLATSPAIDAGSPLAAPAFDFPGVARPVDGNTDGVAAFDIGAYEYSAVHGDATSDGVVDAGDIVFLINYLFAGGAAPPALADANGDGEITIADVMWLVNFVFAGGAAPL